MNAVTPIAAPADATATSHAEEFYRLCGRMVGRYARIEFDIVRAIKALDAEGKIPATLNQRVERLRALIAAKPNSNLASLEKSLDGLRPHLERRNIIVHGCGSIASRSGSWLWPWTMWAAPKTEEERGFWTSQEMRDFYRELNSASDRLHAYVERL